MAGNHMSEMSPRQRMINMMYLVLTALLALNISKEVLMAFKTMDQSIEYSYTDKQEFILKQYQDFQIKSDNNPEKLGEWNDLAIQLQYESQELINVLNSIKDKFVEISGYEDDLPNGMLEQKDNKSLVIKILTKPKSDGGLGYGLMLKEAREEYKSFLLSLDSLGIYEGQSQDSLIQIETRQKYLNLINQLFDTSDKMDDGVPLPWHKGRYYKHVPQAALAFMAQDKLDVANIEGSVLNLIQQKTGQSSITVNYQRGIVNSPKQVIMLGDSFNATVFIAGVDTNQLPKFNLYPYSKDGVRLENSSVIDSLDVKGSQGIFSVKPTKQGTYWLGGDILIQSEEGEKTYEFKQQYVVNEAMSVISPDKMNVLYTSVENPVSISVPGYSSDELSLSSTFSQCKVKWKKNGTYIITIPEQRGKSARKELKLIVKSKATNKAVGEPIVFRIKNVPDPIPMVSTIAGYGELSRADLKGTWGVVAKMKDFDFALRYQVLSYTMSFQGSGGQQDLQSNEGKFPENMTREFNSIKRGQSVIFRDIKVKIAGTDSKPRILPATVTVRIK